MNAYGALHEKLLASEARVKSLESQLASERWRNATLAGVIQSMANVLTNNQAPFRGAQHTVTVRDGFVDRISSEMIGEQYGY